MLCSVGKDRQGTPSHDLLSSQMFQGVLVSASQVVALEDPAMSAAVYVALLLYSPLAACAALAGSFLGSMAGQSL